MRRSFIFFTSVFMLTSLSAALPAPRSNILAARQAPSQQPHRNQRPSAHGGTSAPLEPPPPPVTPPGRSPPSPGPLQLTSPSIRLPGDEDTPPSRPVTPPGKSPSPPPSSQPLPDTKTPLRPVILADRPSPYPSLGEPALPLNEPVPDHGPPTEPRRPTGTRLVLGPGRSRRSLHNHE